MEIIQNDEAFSYEDSDGELHVRRRSKTETQGRNIWGKYGANAVLMCGRNTVGKKWRSGPIKTGKTRVEKHSGQNTGVNAVLGR